MNTSDKVLRNEVSMSPTFDLIDKVAWAMDTPVGKQASDYNIQNNFDDTRELITDGQYIPLEPFTRHEDEVGFELLSDDATPEEVAAQAKAIAEVKAAGKVPFHYETCYVRYVAKAEGKNPDRKRSNRGRGRASATPNIAG